MSKHKNLLFYVCIAGMTLVIAFSFILVNAEVIISDKSNSNYGVVYVAGNEDFYPIEYYDKSTGQFEGIMPKILEAASDTLGIDFVYLKNGKSQTELTENLQVEMVSAHIINSRNDDIEQILPVFSFTQSGHVMRIGWGFTRIADEKLIDALRRYSEGLTEQEKISFLLSAVKNAKRNNNYTIPLVLVAIILAVMIGVIVRIRKTSEKKLINYKMTDMDTGIGNLSYFENAFHKVISDENRCMYHVAYFNIDSNYLKLYHGEVVFKDAIKFTAGLLNSYTDDKCFAARTSVNGFALAFSAVNQQERNRITEEIVGKLNAYIVDNENTDKKYFCVSVYNLSNTDTNSEILLFNLKQKCVEMNQSQQQIAYCSDSMMDSITQEKALLENILKGFKQNEFKLYVQFAVDNKTKKIVSAEALSRWESTDLGFVHPGKYIAALEKSGYINKLDYYMFEACCRQLHKWKDTVLEDLSLSCNFTRTTLSEIGFLGKINDITQKYVFDKEKLIIEITEETIERSLECAIENVKSCKKLGFKIALDDMGTGYTNLINLCDYPIDIVKIDREILLKTDTENGRGLFEGIVALARSLGMKTVCEGVETEEQKSLVEATDCDIVQGWYYSHVFPIKEGEDFAREYIQKK